jgi:endonuclease III
MKYNKFKEGDVLLLRNNLTYLQSLHTVMSFNTFQDALVTPFQHSLVRYNERTMDEMYVSENPTSIHYQNTFTIIGTVLSHEQFEKNTEAANQILLENIRTVNEYNQNRLEGIVTYFPQEKFTLAELESFLSEDVFISNITIDNNTISSLNLLPEEYRELNYTASDLIPLYSGNENMYFQLIGYASTNHVPVEITIFSKDNHKGLVNNYVDLAKQNIAQSTLTGALYSSMLYAYEHKNTVFMQSIVPLLPYNYHTEIELIQSLSLKRNGYSEDQIIHSTTDFLNYIKQSSVFDASPLDSISISYNEGPISIAGKNYSIREAQELLKDLYLYRVSPTDNYKIYLNVHLKNNEKYECMLHIGKHPGVFNPYNEDLLQYMGFHPSIINIPFEQSTKIIKATKEEEAKNVKHRSELSPSVLKSQGEESKVNISFFGSSSVWTDAHSENLNLYNLYDGTKLIQTGSKTQLEHYTINHHDLIVNQPTIEMATKKTQILVAVSDPYLMGDKISYKLYTEKMDKKDSTETFLYHVSTPLSNIESILSLHENHVLQSKRQLVHQFDYEPAKKQEQLFFQLLNLNPEYVTPEHTEAMIILWENLSREDQLLLVNTDRGQDAHFKLDTFIQNHTTPIAPLTLAGFMEHYGNTADYFDEKHLVNTIQENFQHITGKNTVLINCPNENIIVDLISFYKHNPNTFLNEWSDQAKQLTNSSEQTSFDNDITFRQAHQYHSDKTVNEVTQDEMLHFLFSNYKVFTKEDEFSKESQYVKEFSKNFNVPIDVMENKWNSFLATQDKIEPNRIELFDMYHMLPEKIQVILSKYSDDNMNYKKCENLLKEMKKEGYTFEYGLDASPGGLRPMTKKEIEIEIKPPNQNNQMSM